MKTGRHVERREPEAWTKAILNKQSSKAFVLAFSWAANYHVTAAKRAGSGLFRSVILSNS